LVPDDGQTGKCPPIVLGNALVLINRGKLPVVGKPGGAIGRSLSRLGLDVMIS